MEFSTSFIQLSQNGPMYILRGNKLQCPQKIVFLSMTSDFDLANSADLITGASPVFTVCHKVISLTSRQVYSLFQYIIGDGTLLSWTGPCGHDEMPP